MGQPVRKRCLASNIGQQSAVSDPCVRSLRLGAAYADIRTIVLALPIALGPTGPSPKRDARGVIPLLSPKLVTPEKHRCARSAW